MVPLFLLASGATLPPPPWKSVSGFPRAWTGTGHPDSASLAEIALRHAPDLGKELRLGHWKQAHPLDRITPRTGERHDGRLRTAEGQESRYHFTWCARAETELPLTRGGMATRSAYFYLPPAPEPLALPKASDAPFLMDECRLGLLWIEARFPDSGEAQAYASLTTQRLSKVLGEPDPESALHWWGAAYWQKKARWQEGHIMVAVAARVGWNREAEDPTPVFVIATGPPSELDLSTWRRTGRLPDPREEQRRREGQRLQEALSILGHGGGPGGRDGIVLGEAMRAFLAGMGGGPPADRHMTDQEMGAFLTLVEDLHSSIPKLDPPRQAAALLALDHLLAGFQWQARFWDRERPEVRESLKELDTEFEYSPLGGVWIYTRTWLKEAAKAYADYRAGELAFLAWTETGFDTSGTCREHGSDGFVEVIRRGEAYLRDRPDSSIRADLHFMLARAYSDIVAMAGGAGYFPSESEPYVHQAAEARRRALDHYHLAFERAPESLQAQISWPEAWRLTAGLDPAHLHFYCFYD